VLTVTQERDRAVQAATSETEHAELVERINQLAILRESNATLRADCEAHQRRSRELDARLKEVSAELDPVKDQLRRVQGEIEVRDARVQRLEAESASWQERNRQLLSKVCLLPHLEGCMKLTGMIQYDRIDPAEMQVLKDEIEKLKAEKATIDLVVAERDQQLLTNAERVRTLPGGAFVS
jgi:nucleoprotein TPR